MSLVFEVTPRSGGWWVINRDRESGPYEEKEAAFLAAVRLARNAKANGKRAEVKVRHQPAAANDA